MDTQQPSSRPTPSNGTHSDHAVLEANWFWGAAALLIARWRFVAVVAGIAGVVAVVLALTLPREYAADARVLQPESSGLAGLMGIADRASGGLGRLLTGGSGGDYTRYLAILNSRSLRESVIEEFDLVRVYDVESKSYPMEAALNRLDRNLEFRVNADYRDLAIIAYDRDPARAAAMANFITDELNRRHARMTSESARQTRVFVEQRLLEARTDLDSLQGQMQALQEQHGVVELESQAQAFMTAMATQSARTAELEVRYHTLLSQYGPDNPQARAARDAYVAAQALERRVLGGGEALMPVALREMPALARQYATIMQEQMIQAKVIETIYPLYEQAQFQERSEAQAVQILDPAIVPNQAARPSRRMIVAATVLTALFGACLFLLGQAWLAQNHYLIASRLGIRSETPAPADPRPHQPV